MTTEMKLQSDAATNLGMPRIAGKHQKLGEKHGIDSPQNL